MKNAQIFNTVLYLFGIGLICALFFVLIKEAFTENVFWLNLVVSVGIYSLFMFNSGRLFISSKEMDTNWGAIGIRWLFTWLYAALAIVVMVVMFYYDVIFAVQIIVQAALILLLLFGFFFSMVVNNQASRVATQHKREQLGLDNMREIVSRFEIYISTKNPDKAVISLLENIKENLRYLSPSTDSIAIDLENQFIAELSDTMASISRGDKHLNTDEILNYLGSCNTILKQRKNFRYN